MRQMWSRAGGRHEPRSARHEAGQAVLVEVGALAAELGAGPDSELGKKLGEARAALEHP